MKTKFLAGASVLALVIGAPSAGRDVAPMAVRATYAAKAFHAPPPARGETLLYDQSNSEGFAKYAVPSWENISANASSCCNPYIAADDFIIPGRDKHTITAVFAAGGQNDVNGYIVTFFSYLRYDKKTGTTTAVVQATCSYMPFTTENGGELIDLSSCASGAFKGGHDYAVSVQAQTTGSSWYWQTNRKRIGRPGLWYDQGAQGRGSCFKQLTPIKFCFPAKGYGPDLAFAIYGN